MRFDSFFGNEELKRRLSAGFAAGKISHAYLLCGPEGSGKHTLAQLLAAAMECIESEPLPCGHCAACRKVFSNQHPDVITVDDPDHKNVAVEVIRQARTDVFTRPNEGRRKVYIIPRAQDMGPASQNALLKILEEPPAYAAFLLLCEQADKLLPTIRSRCVELRLSPLSEAQALPILRQRFPQQDDEALRSALNRCGGFLGQAQQLLSQDQGSELTRAFASAYARKDRAALLEVLLPLEKRKRDELLPILGQWRQLLCDALTAKSGLPAASAEAALLCQRRTGIQLLAADQALVQALADLEQNVGVGTILGWLSVKLR